MSEYQLKPGTSVLVTGATGFTGSFLIRRLVELGASVKAIARQKSNVDQFKDLPIEWIRGEVFDAEAIKKGVAGVEFIFHVAAAYREAKIQDKDYHNVHVLSTKLLAEEAIKSPTFKRFIHVSTVGVHGHIENPPADENAPFAPGDVYQNTKLEGELWIRDFAKANKMSLAVVRPAAILGPGDKRLLKVFKMATKPVFPLLGFGRCLYHLIHVEDLVELIIQAAVHPAADGEVFICGNDAPIELVEFGRIVSGLIGRKLRVLRVPVSPFMMLGAICEWICKPLGIEPPIYRRRVAFFTKDRAFNTGKIQNRLGYRYKYSNKSGIESTARWYLDNGWLKS
jgi:nucleoside-diphosphate-sugar epimerase